MQVSSFGGIGLTLIDSLDTLVVLGDREEFSRAVQWLQANVSFAKDQRVYAPSAPSLPPPISSLSPPGYRPTTAALM